MKKKTSTTKRQTKAKGKRSISADKKRVAKHPGPRVSASGNMYSERRVNRSDKDRRRRL